MGEEFFVEGCLEMEEIQVKIFQTSIPHIYLCTMSYGQVDISEIESNISTFYHKQNRRKQK